MCSISSKNRTDRTDFFSKFSLHALFSVFSVTTVIAFCLLFLLLSSWLLCAYRETLSAPLITHTYLIAMKKDNSSIPQVIFPNVFCWTQTQLPQWERGHNWVPLFHLCLSSLFSHMPARLKASEESRWAKSVVTYSMNPQKYVAAVVKEISVKCSPLRQNIERMREAEGRRRRAVEVCWGCIQWVVVRPPVGCHFALWFLYRPLPNEGEAGRMAGSGWVVKPIHLQHFC